MPTKTIPAIILNILFGGVGYLYIKRRTPLAIFLIAVTTYELIRNIVVVSGPTVHIDPLAIHTLPMLSLFGSIPGAIFLTIMAVDVYLLTKQQATKPSVQNSKG